MNLSRTLCAAALAALVSGPTGAHTDIALDYRGKPASQATRAANQSLAERLNWNDTQAFADAQRGLVAPFDAATEAVLRKQFEFIGDAIPATVNPSLYRQAQLNQTAGGLYRVSEGIYQVRGTDLANMTLIRGESGWILYDVLLTREAADQSLQFALANLPEGGELPVVALIISHSHADHFGGAGAIVDRYPGIPVYGPNQITREVLDENVLAGNAMSRRAAYQYGATLGASERGIVDAALGKGLSKGEISYVAPTYELNRAGRLERLMLDGVEMLFLDVPGAEAPAEVVTYLPAQKVLWGAELVYHGMHNIYTLRGAKVRDALAWSKYINEMLVYWGDEVEVLLAAHSAPVWGNESIRAFLRLQRDNYGLVHNQTLRLANNGVPLQDIGEALEAAIPESVSRAWHTKGYHGTYSHNAKAVYNRYLGYFDMNPANLNPLPVVAEAKKYLLYLGGADRVVERARGDFERGEYRFVATVLNKVVTAEPGHRGARELLADTYEQLGYQAEGAGWRNIYLTGAQELRVGILPGAPKAASQDVVRQMSLAQLFDYLAVRVDSLKADSLGSLSLNVVNADTREVLFVELDHGNLNNLAVESPRPADTSLTIAPGDLMGVLMGQVQLGALLKAGRAQLEGDAGTLGKLFSTLVSFDPGFEIVPLPPTP
ncbi:alkyl/aryl-sulfatase [Aestuariirhabdus litorea]|uniref:MBL fold metallo-hydrolase n=1 Tax=Aestuariirhabdus litorea TaxID=2528527 RepID=A0A3P3VNH4_9GAMM|nr:alkyl sulfatase dimerization domain-containing protein [Aestuariirhabdus litorea]RRJ83196.1 MBL fold metallo-hydrolase [Aestuariirhabdus litorea]RWW93353.1 MBL fold metallo-hydrolase [Endozoicomonadaceae bacterium GTF-13]